MLTYPSRRKSGVPYPLLPSLSGLGKLQAESSSADVYDVLEDVVEDGYYLHIRIYIHIHTFIDTYIHNQIQHCEVVCKRCESDCDAKAAAVRFPPTIAKPAR